MYLSSTLRWLFFNHICIPLLQITYSILTCAVIYTTYCLSKLNEGDIIGLRYNKQVYLAEKQSPARNCCNFRKLWRFENEWFMVIYNKESYKSISLYVIRIFCNIPFWHRSFHWQNWFWLRTQRVTIKKSTQLFRFIISIYSE